MRSILTQTLLSLSVLTAAVAFDDATLDLTQILEAKDLISRLELMKKNIKAFSLASRPAFPTLLSRSEQHHKTLENLRRLDEVLSRIAALLSRRVLTDNEAAAIDEDLKRLTFYALQAEQALVGIYHYVDVSWQEEAALAKESTNNSMNRLIHGYHVATHDLKHITRTFTTLAGNKFFRIPQDQNLYQENLTESEIYLNELLKRGISCP